MITLGTFEQLVLLAVLRLGEGAYGMAVRQEIAVRTGREVSIGATYTTLDRLERKGLVGSETRAGGPARGGNARRRFSLTSAGAGALAQSLAALDRMRAGIPRLA